jgi:glycerol-3-phosphate dehydrogenase
MAWDRDSRSQIWSRLDQKWDLIIIGGGITGAGILREAARLGLRTLLVEAGDYAQGTSSKSSKLVHGGLRYLKNGQVKTTLESVTEREFLLRQGKGLVNRLGFLFVNLKGDRMPAWLFGLGLSAYDMMARQWTHRSYDAMDICELCPPLSTPLLRGGYRYFDAQTDDARLVLRLLQEGVHYGGTALNYARVTHLLRDQQSQVHGVVLRDEASLDRPEMEIQARAVINATGAWADFLRTGESQRPRLRPIRGSHLVLSEKRLPLTRAISLMHPRNGRPVFLIPWEGVILVGTTDVDHTDMQNEPRISALEAEFLLEAVQHVFPESHIESGDIQATFSGLRPVISSGKSDPSKESREHAVWFENGLLTVTGGKLTTFRLMAFQALRELQREFPNLAPLDRSQPVLLPPPTLDGLDAAAALKA